MLRRYLQDVDFTGGAVDIELAVGRIFEIDTLTREEIDDALLAILVAVSGRNLNIQRVHQSVPTNQINNG